MSKVELLTVLLSWATTLSGYSVAELPEVQFKPHSFFVENACLIKPYYHAWGWQELRPIKQKNCKVEGWYNDKYIIYIDKKYSDLEGFGSSLVVHEMVHYLQHLDGMTDSCLREREAYQTQNDYIREVLATVYYIPRRGCL